MKWSQLKKRVEANFADVLQGRLEVWNTRYRQSHDAEGEAWITFDGEQVAGMGSMTYFNALYVESTRIQKESGCSDYTDPEQMQGYQEAIGDADKIVADKGYFPMSGFNRALFDFLNMPIEEAIQSEQPLYRVLAVVDRRFGKRRLRNFDTTKETELVKQFFLIRCNAEGIHPHKG